MPRLEPFSAELSVQRAQNGMLDAANLDLHNEVGYLVGQVRDLEESLLEISDRFDNIGWSPLEKPDDANEMSLDTLKKVSKLARAMNIMNPFVKRGVNARISYVWGKGVSFDGVEDIGDVIALNRKRLFSAQAYEELERVLATDGNAFTAVPIDKSKSSYRIPLSQIDGAVFDPDDAETILFFKRTHEKVRTDGRTGETSSETVTEYYASFEYWKQRKAKGKNLPRTWKSVPVNKEYVVHHLAVNKQVGWHWGVPDVMPVIFWAKAYKEYLEDNALLVKAYSRLAWSVRAANRGGAQAASAQLLAPPTRDPMTGDLRNIGATSVMGTGTEVQAMPATGSQVDFEKGSALAAAIASGLEVSKVVITSDPGQGNRSAAETLDGPTLKAMESRQKIHEERFLDLFDFWGLKIAPFGTNPHNITEAKEEAGDKPKANSGRDYASVSWPQIESDATKDRVAALGTALELNVLYPEEVRKEALDVLGIAPWKPWDEVPEEKEPLALGGVSGEQGNTQPSVIAKQGVSGGVTAKGGAQATKNSARDNREKDSGK